MKLNSNIAILIPSLECGGAERSASLLANYLMEKGGYNVFFFTLSKGESFYSLNPKIEIFSIDDNIKNLNKALKNIERVNMIKKLNRNFEIDLIVGYTSLSAILASAACLSSNTKCIVCERSNPENTVLNQKILRYFLYRKTDGAVFQSEYAQKYLNSLVRNSIIVPNFIETSKLPSVIPLQNRLKKIVSVGRLVDVKNHKMLISAFEIVSKDIPDYYVEIYGEGPLYNELNSYILEKNMQNKVFLKGKTDDVFENIKDASLFVFTSNYEGFPNALLEAVSLGLPSITTDCPAFAPRQIIEEFEFGGIVARNNDQELAEEIKKSINKKINENELLMKTESIRRNYDIEFLLDKWVNYIEQTISGGILNDYSI